MERSERPPPGIRRAAKIKMTFYLADTENIARDWHLFAQDAEQGDTFILFYSKHVGPVSMSLFGPASAKGVRFRFVECRMGSNAMDFQIATELGWLVARHPDAAFIVLSKDTGFDVAVKYWQDRGMNVTRQSMPIPRDVFPEIEPYATLPPEIPAMDTNSRPQDDGVAIESSWDELPPEDYAPIKMPVPPEPEQDMRNDEACVKRAYREQLAGTGLSGDDLHVATGILYAAMAYPQNARKLQVYNRFQQRYGAKDGQTRYNAIKSAVRRISAEGPFPPKSAKPPVKPASLDANPGQAHAANRKTPARNAGRAAPRPMPRTDGEIIAAIKAKCPGMAPKAYEKIMHMIKHSRNVKNPYVTYKRQLVQSIGEPAAKDVYARTSYLVRPEKN